MGYKIIKIGSINNIDKAYMHGYYNISGSSYGVPNGSETTVHTVNVGSNTTAQIAFQYQNSVYAGRCYFRVGAVPQISDGTPSSNWQSWIELHGVGKPYSANIVFDKTATRNIGSSSNTVNNLYMQNAVTVVSDENYKTEIQDIPDNVLDAWSKVNFQMYKLNAAVQEKGGDARFHFGVIAQRIKDAFDSAGLDFNEYGLLTYDKWDAIQEVKYQEATYDNKGNELTPEVQEVEPREAGEVYMVRYDECMVLEMAYQRKRLADIEAKLKS